ncbi:MAG: serine/threonine protein kinase [Lachnospiraceae bacterium]|nr:serine/threonine protein kinase [Lachnospiraceae bacterium]
MQEKMTVNQIEYNIIKLLGRGKGGYSYLAEKDGKQYVLKQIHHEPCDYYTFGNKIESEKNDYARLVETGIRIPKMLDIDIQNERILKEYIDGPTIYDLVKDDGVKETYLAQMKDMAKLVYSAGLNIDYFPTNFVVQDELIYYIDYECNNYMDEWNFENWGIKYWSKTQEFLDYAKEH